MQMIRDEESHAEGHISVAQPHEMLETEKTGNDHSGVHANRSTNQRSPSEEDDSQGIATL